MERWVGKVAVVTGASSGIGEAIAENLVMVGMIVVGLARSMDRMQNIQRRLASMNGTFLPYKCDISDENNVIEAFEWIRETLGGVHVLVNDAGTATFSSMLDVNQTEVARVFGVNVFGMLACTRQAVAIMRETRFEGTIVNINSVLGHDVHFYEGVQIGVYSGTKYSVTSITESLQRELREAKLRIRVTSLSPGATKTRLFNPSVLPPSSGDVPFLDPADIASGVNYVLSVPQHVHIAEITIKPLGEFF